MPSRKSRQNVNPDPEFTSLIPESSEEDSIEVDESGKPLNDETKELIQLFTGLRGGPDVIKYFNNLHITERKTLLKIVQREMGTIRVRGKRKKITKIIPAKPILIRILEVINYPPGLKMELLNRYFAPGASPEKNMQWMETILRVPFNRSAPRITREDLANSQEILDSAIYGHQEAKHKLITYIAQLVRNQDSTGLILGLRSYPGVGKTNLIESGVSKILRRPFFSTSLGGVNGSEMFRGFQYTFEGSEPGYIARSLITAQVMNPVFFFDELDKISKTPQGDEIVNCIIQVTDPIQSTTFQDRYLGSRATLDLSRCVFVFAYNDPSSLNPILRDRITEIELNGFSEDDKIIIARDYMIPRIIKDVGIPDERLPVIRDSALIEIINRYTNEAGVRHLRRVLYEIFMEINLHDLMETPNPVIIWKNRRRRFEEVHSEERMVVEIENLEKFIKTYKPIVIERTIEGHMTGRVNGLFVDTSGCSGILPVEASWIPSIKKDMKCTGNIGKIMGESMHVAWSVAWSLLNKEKQDENYEKMKERHLHIHCRDNAMPKDGPSAGVAITVLIWSMLTGKAIPQDMSYTGEIALSGELLAIGGLSEKLVGAYRGGSAMVIIPSTNIDNLPDKIPGKMKVIPCKTIQEVMALF